MAATAQGTRGIGELIHDVAEDASRLARQEVHLARVELAEIVRGIGKGTAMMVAAGALGILAVQIFVFGIVLLMGEELLRGRYWLAAFLTTALMGLAAFVLVRKGLGALTPKNMIPDQTVASLKEDKEWLKQQRKSVAISK